MGRRPEFTEEEGARNRRAVEAQHGPEEPFSDEERTAAGLEPLYDDEGRPTKADNAAFKKEARERDEAMRRVHQAGVQEGRAAPSNRGARAQRKATSTSATKSSSSWSSTATKAAKAALRLLQGKKISPAAMFLGLVTWAVIDNFLVGGPARAKQWFDAKFFNITTPSTPAREKIPRTVVGTPPPKPKKAAAVPDTLRAPGTAGLPSGEVAA